MHMDVMRSNSPVITCGREDLRSMTAICVESPGVCCSTVRFIIQFQPPFLGEISDLFKGQTFATIDLMGDYFHMCRRIFLESSILYLFDDYA